MDGRKGKHGLRTLTLAWVVTICLVCDGNGSSPATAEPAGDASAGRAFGRRFLACVDMGKCPEAYFSLAESVQADLPYSVFCGQIQHLGVREGQPVSRIGREVAIDPALLAGEENFKPVWSAEYVRHSGNGQAMTERIQVVEGAGGLAVYAYNIAPESSGSNQVAQPLEPDMVPATCTDDSLSDLTRLLEATEAGPQRYRGNLIVRFAPDRTSRADSIVARLRSADLTWIAFSAPSLDRLVRIPGVNFRPIGIADLRGVSGNQITDVVAVLAEIGTSSHFTVLIFLGETVPLAVSVFNADLSGPNAYHVWRDNVERQGAP
ncbi:MAG: hypothetical protein H7A21_10210 [Spirochaetales bacterium]|nr:hypothetical protein [Leptospiraceae bacterium]MCP5481797.1 hypothetical protein [Spirochaetales bacterium]MCP5486913.1 hypothetical protein [Spirochaetales bacterium]